MKTYAFNSSRLSAGFRGPRSRAGFTLIEIALCLAIIGLALVAIIGVMPTGVKVQKENREETIIGQDGLFLLEAIRSGARGIDDLTNYVESIMITNWFAGQARPGGVVIYTNSLNPRPFLPLTNGWHIVSLLSTPKLQMVKDDLVTNIVVAYVRSINGVAAEKSVTNPNAGEFAFRYQVRCELIPFTQPPPPNTNEVFRAFDLANNLHDVRLTLSWPLYQRGNVWDVGNNRRVFRTLVSGRLNRNLQAPLMEPNAYATRF